MQPSPIFFFGITKALEIKRIMNLKQTQVESQCKLTACRQVVDLEQWVVFILDVC